MCQDLGLGTAHSKFITQNWPRGEEPTAPSGQWETAKLPGESVLEEPCCPTRPQVTSLFSKSSGLPSHPVGEASWVGSRAVASLFSHPSPCPGAPRPTLSPFSPKTAFFFFFFGLHLQFMDISRLGVELELQLLPIPQPPQQNAQSRQLL